MVNHLLVDLLPGSVTYGVTTAWAMNNAAKEHNFRLTFNPESILFTVLNSFSKSLFKIDRTLDFEQALINET